MGHAGISGLPHEGGDIWGSAQKDRPKSRASISGSRDLLVIDLKELVILHFLFLSFRLAYEGMASRGHFHTCMSLFFVLPPRTCSFESETPEVKAWPSRSPVE